MLVFNLLTKPFTMAFVRNKLLYERGQVMSNASHHPPPAKARGGWLILNFSFAFLCKKNR